ncbi:ArsR/SmtB family transcription factor [Chloroflexota bacterium]
MLENINDNSKVEIFRLQAEFCKCISNHTRLQIIHELRNAERSVSELAESLGMKPSATSRHLAVLRKASVIASRREYLTVYYSLIDPKIVEACDLVFEVIARQAQRTNHVVGSQ